MILAPLRLPTSLLGRGALAGAAALAAAALALSPGGLAPVASRAALAAGAVLALWVLVRRRGSPGALAPAVAVVDRVRLAPGAGIVLVEAGGRRLLVGFGREGARLVADLGPARPSTGSGRADSRGDGLEAKKAQTLVSATDLDRAGDHPDRASPFALRQAHSTGSGQARGERREARPFVVSPSNHAESRVREDAP